MKKKTFIGGGIIILAIAIVGILAFSQGGEYFQGSTFGDFEIPTMDDITPDYPEELEEQASEDETGDDDVPSLLAEGVQTFDIDNNTDDISPDYLDAITENPIEEDVCPNLEGVQTSVPSGFELVDGNCEFISGVDECDNIEGIQTSVPSGYEWIDGDCLPIGDPDPGQTEEVECGAWTDVSSNDQEYDMWMYLCNKGIVEGNADGTLRPEEKLNRAELLALAFRASDYENVYNVDDDADYCFSDVKNEWFAKYFCTAKKKDFIEGYKDGNAKPGRDVILAEGLKIFLGALDEPFDVSDPDCWYCDMVDEAGDDKYIPYSFSDPTQVGPIELTRRKAFNMLYRIMIYK